MRSNAGMVLWAGLGAALAVLSLGSILVLMARFFSLSATSFAVAVYDNSLLIGLLALVSLTLLAAGDRRVYGRRPFTFVPLDGHFWEFTVFGAVAVLLGSALMLSLAGTLVVLPVLVPVKTVLDILSGRATLGSALIGLPVTLVALSVGFAAIYLLLGAKGLGTLESESGPLASRPDEHRATRISDILFFSLAIMIGFGPSGAEPRGWCRWAAVLQALVSKGIEIIIVGVGIAIIVGRRH